MNQANIHLRSLTDSRLPALPAMLGPDCRELLQAALALGGGRLISARPSQVHWHPGISLTVVYESSVARSGHAAPTAERLVATTGASIPEGAVLLNRDEEQVGVWLQANDPVLRGLASALDAAKARLLLDQLAVAPGAVKSRLRSYRPMRRAVVEIMAGRTRLFAKIVPPGEAEALYERHAAAAGLIPTPRSLGWSAPDGLVMLESLPGATLREALSSPEQRLPPPGQIVGLLDALPWQADAAERVPGPFASALRHSKLLGVLVPELKTMLAGITERLVDDEFEGPLVSVHGDFYEAQILVRAGAIAGLLDIDRAGIGSRINDWATIIGHLAVRTEFAEASARPRTRSYSRQLLTIAESQVDAAALRRRIAAVILAIATGPFRVQTPSWPADTTRRIALASRWMESAEKRAITGNDSPDLAGVLETVPTDKGQLTGVSR